MASKASIISAINAKVGPIYSSYRIGLTHDLAERKTYWGETKGEGIACWANWTADSLADAQEIEAHFIYDKKMKGGVGGDLSANKTVYVYVF
jgi:hypothetical protein